VWGVLKGSERDGSLRFEWLDSDHKLKMLEALSMLPVRIQVYYEFISLIYSVITRKVTLNITKNIYLININFD